MTNESHEHCRAKKTHPIVSSLAVVGTAGVGVLGWLNYSLSDKIDGAKEEMQALRDSVRGVERKADAKDLERLEFNLDKLRQGDQVELERLQDRLERIGLRVDQIGVDLSADLEQTQMQLENYGAEAQAAALKTTDLIAALVRRLDGQLQQVDLTIDERIAKNEKIFQQAYEKVEPAIYLICTEFNYVTDLGKKDETTHTARCWGTGFVVTPEGHMVTCKHVINPWLFDRDLLLLEATGDAKIDRSSLKISVWSAGSECLDAAGDGLTTTCFSTVGAANLKVLALAEDIVVTEKIGLLGIEIKPHGLNDNDLAIIKLEAKGNLPYINIATQGTGAKKLDRVMAVGFPRGCNGLEKQRAECSATTGVVRKVENTLHITAPIDPGNSGGPIVLEDGRVVGVATRTYNSTLGICIDIGKAQALLEQNYCPTDYDVSIATLANIFRK